MLYPFVAVGDLFLKSNTPTRFDVARCCFSGIRSALATLNPFFLNQPRKVFKGSIIGPFSIIWKAAGRKFTAAQVIAQALATNAFARARFIRAVATSEMLFFAAFHQVLLCC
jgi:hypothetical protein